MQSQAESNLMEHDRWSASNSISGRSSSSRCMRLNSSLSTIVFADSNDESRRSCPMSVLRRPASRSILSRFSDIPIGASSRASSNATLSLASGELARLSVALELAREDAPMGMSENLERIEREAGRLNTLIGQLLRLSSLESANTIVDSEEFSLMHLLEELLPDIEFEALQRSCSIKLDSACDCIVHGNSQLVYRAIENIARNAIRYTKEVSSVDIHLSCEM